MRVPGAKLCTAALLLCATLSAAAPAKKKGSGNINIIDVIIKLGSFRDLRTVMENAVTGVVSPKACSICAAATGMLFDYLDSGRSSNGLVKLIQGACAFLKIANPDACASVIDMYKLKAEGSAEAAGSPVKVLHISDTHYDPEYEEGSNGACADPICCRAHNGAPASAAARAGKWGHRGKCDIPLRTLESALQHAAEKNQASGSDLSSPHGPCAQSSTRGG
ncbi:hypothetical protein HPB48_015745 [Haemaphysalis longicornis]|uniref:Sphingomyelin phosphodiesterase n=1 Tax=Haemaphysalis longicornis TaxID=44386 RepID=A0A9J6H6F9_HAELO|nr:hypothetical protein HPB48_015745 [Haemaphysalis longicornis]